MISRQTRFKCNIYYCFLFFYFFLCRFHKVYVCHGCSRLSDTYFYINFFNWEFFMGFVTHIFHNQKPNWIKWAFIIKESGAFQHKNIKKKKEDFHTNWNVTAGFCFKNFYACYVTLLPDVSWMFFCLLIHHLYCKQQHPDGRREEKAYFIFFHKIKWK